MGHIRTDANVMQQQPMIILHVEDEPAHAEIMRLALEESAFHQLLIHVADGQAALDYLYRRADYADSAISPRPDLILLDLRMPKVDGLEVLKILKEDQHLACIPIVVLTTSSADNDLKTAYSLHANSYLTKPVDFEKFTAMVAILCDYWLGINCPPPVAEKGQPTTKKTGSVLL